MTIKVYGTKQSTCSQRVYLALHEKEIYDYHIVHVDLMKGEHKRPEFLKIQVNYCNYWIHWNAIERLLLLSWSAYYSSCHMCVDLRTSRKIILISMLQLKRMIVFNPWNWSWMCSPLQRSQYTKMKRWQSLVRYINTYNHHGKNVLACPTSFK
jgi:hypothetical protein